MASDAKIGVAERWRQLTGRGAEEIDPSDEVIGQARAFSDWMNMPYYERFTGWLDARIDDPIDIKDHMTMIGLTARANTFKEVKLYLKGLEKRAAQALEE